MRGTVGNVGEAAFLRKAPPQTSPGKHFDPRIIKPKRYVVSRMQRGQCGSKAQTLAVLMYGGQWSPSEPAEASGCRPCPGRQCRQEFSGEFWKTGEISRFNLWRLISCAVRRKQVEPGTARTAATAGCKPCPGRQCRQEFFGEFRKTGEISRFNLWRLISCAVRRMQPEPGTARTAATPPNTLRRSAQIRRLRELQSMGPEVVCCPAAAGACRLSLPGRS